MPATFSSAPSCVGKTGLVLKDKQLEPLKCYCAGSNVFLWVPTGYGKSVSAFRCPFLLARALSQNSPWISMINTKGRDTKATWSHLDLSLRNCNTWLPFIRFVIYSAYASNLIANLQKVLLQNYYEITPCT